MLPFEVNQTTLVLCVTGTCFELFSGKSEEKMVTCMPSAFQLNSSVSHDITSVWATGASEFTCLKVWVTS